MLEPIFRENIRLMHRTLNSCENRREGRIFFGLMSFLQLNVQRLHLLYMSKAERSLATNFSISIVSFTWLSISTFSIITFALFKFIFQFSRTVRYLLGKSTRNSRVVNAPGSTALAAVRFLFPKKVVDNVFSQVVADMREENAEALAKRKFKQARWIVVRDHINLALTVVVFLTVSIGKRLLTVWKIIP